MTASRSWYLRSMADQDTHLGPALLSPNGTVAAICGIEFTPKPLGLSGDRVALSGEPPDPDQICLQCKERRGSRQ